MKICIPSKDRAESISTHLFFNPKDVLIFVEPQEIKKYKIFNPEYNFINIENNDKGLSYARNYILDYVDNENIIMADDDYKIFGKRNEMGRYNRIQNCQEIVDTIEKSINNYAGYGIADDVFGYYMNKSSNNQRLFINRQIMRDFYGMNTSWIKEKNIRYDEKIRQSEDVDFNIMIVINGGKICNDFLYSRTKIHRNSGGLEKERGGILNKDQAMRIHLDDLVKKYGAEFFSSSHDEKGYLKSETLKFDLIAKRSDIVRENIKKYNRLN